MTQLADNIICKTRFLSFFQQNSWCVCVVLCCAVCTYAFRCVVLRESNLTCFLTFFRNYVQLFGCIIAVLVAVLFAYTSGVEDALGTSLIPGI